MRKFRWAFIFFLLRKMSFSIIILKENDLFMIKTMLHCLAFKNEQIILFKILLYLTQIWRVGHFVSGRDLG